MIVKEQNQQYTSITRHRRLRINPSLRDVVTENSIQPQQLIKPVFVHSGKDHIPLVQLPNSSILSVTGLLVEVEKLMNIGILGINLYPKIASTDKDLEAKEALNPNGIIPIAIKAIKQRFPNFLVIPDVALDPYTSHGHDGLLDVNGRILNDESICLLAQQSVLFAEAGADMVAPSDMFDGRTMAIRLALDQAGLPYVGIIAYAAKYASAYYGPFRAALGNAARKLDKRSYQLEPANALQALDEIVTDVNEGADIIMIKPAGHYLDIVSRARALINKPIAVFQVSGECAMIKLAAQAGIGDERELLFEQLISMKRAGASLIFTYYAETMFTK